MLGKSNLLITGGEKDVRTRVIDTLQRFRIKQVDVARETGIHNSTLSLWLQAKIKGHQVKIEETLDEWLKNLNSNKPHQSTIGQQQYSGSGSHHHHHSHFQPIQNLKSSYLNKQGGQTKKQNQDVYEHLIPIYIDIEIDGQRFKEHFLWNFYETHISPESFAKIIANENNFPLQFENEVAQTIKRGIQNFRNYIPKDEEIVKVIELNIRIDNIQLKDKFEWDINNPKNDPEAFAWSLCGELGLNGEFAQRISHQVREQILYYQRQFTDKKAANIALNGFEDISMLKKSTRSLIESGSAFTNIETKQQNFVQGVITENNYMRPIYTQESTSLSQWEPSIEILDQNDIKKMQKLEDRKNRYSRRIR